MQPHNVFTIIIDHFIDEKTEVQRDSMMFSILHG